MLLLALAVLAVAGCGEDADSKARSGSSGAASTQTSAEPEAVASIIGQPLSASAQQLKMRTAEGSRTFLIRPEDLASVEPEHVGSHVGVTDIAFRIYYEEVDGQEFAVGSEEVSVDEMG